ncbi:uncharacterized protein LOC112003370 isoform X2 [Quercus suber]
MEGDIIQLCQICRTSGVRVSFDSTNTRDSFYRASVDFVLNVCRRAPTHCTSVQIDGEDAWKFVAGLAENICAAIIVSAAVAARTRSRFLQAWVIFQLIFMIQLYIWSYNKSWWGSGEMY